MFRSRFVQYVLNITTFWTVVKRGSCRKGWKGMTINGKYEWVSEDHRRFFVAVGDNEVFGVRWVRTPLSVGDQVVGERPMPPPPVPAKTLANRRQPFAIARVIKSGVLSNSAVVIGGRRVDHNLGTNQPRY